MIINNGILGVSSYFLKCDLLLPYYCAGRNSHRECRWPLDNVGIRDPNAPIKNPSFLKLLLLFSETVTPLHHFLLLFPSIHLSFLSFKCMATIVMDCYYTHMYIHINSQRHLFSLHNFTCIYMFSQLTIWCWTIN